MKKYYSKPESEITEFLTVDVITTSGGSPLAPDPDPGEEPDPFD